MESFKFAKKFVGNRYAHLSQNGTATAETDSGAVKLLLDNGQEVWLAFEKLQPELSEQVLAAA